MARKFGVLTASGEVALTAATTKTVLQLATPASIRAVIQGGTISFDGTSVTQEPVQVEWVFQTNGGTGTTRNPTLIKQGIEALQCTGKENMTVEPTGPTIIHGIEIHPQAGYEFKLPLPCEIELGASGFIGIRCTSPSAVNCRASLCFEE